MRLSTWIDSIAASKGASMAKGNAITQGFAQPVSYIAGRSIHGGLDIRGALGTPITALRGGKVTLSRLNGGWGENVIIQTDHDMFHWYAHLTRRDVAVGQIVATGQQIGTLGTTGNSTGPHLHFEVRSSAGQFYTLEDPFVFYDTPVPKPPEPAPVETPFVPSVEQQQSYDFLMNAGVFSDKTPRNAPMTTESFAVFMKRAADKGLLNPPA